MLRVHRGVLISTRTRAQNNAAPHMGGKIWFRSPHGKPGMKIRVFAPRAFPTIQVIHGHPRGRARCVSPTASSLTRKSLRSSAEIPGLTVLTTSTPRAPCSSYYKQLPGTKRATWSITFCVTQTPLYNHRQPVAYSMTLCVPQTLLLSII